MKLSFFSENPGVRRLAIFLAVLSTITGTIWALDHPYRELQERWWAHRYVEDRQAQYPGSRVASRPDEVVLLAENGYRIQSFRQGSDRAPSSWEYLLPVLYIFGIGLAPLLLTHAIAWVYRGFQ